MVSFHRDVRGSAVTETAAVIPIIVILFALIADSFWVFHPAIGKEVEIRALMWGKLRDAYATVKQDVDGEASDSSDKSGVGTLAAEFTTLQFLKGFDHLSLWEPAFKWDVHKVKLDAEWHRTLKDQGSIEASFDAAMVTDVNLGPDSHPCFLEIMKPWAKPLTGPIPGC